MITHIIFIVHRLKSPGTGSSCSAHHQSVASDASLLELLSSLGSAIHLLAVVCAVLHHGTSSTMQHLRLPLLSLTHDIQGLMQRQRHQIRKFSHHSNEVRPCLDEIVHRLLEVSLVQQEGRALFVQLADVDTTQIVSVCAGRAERYGFLVQICTGQRVDLYYVDAKINGRFEGEQWSYLVHDWNHLQSRQLLAVA